MRRLLLSTAVAGVCGWLSGTSYAQEELPREPVPAVAEAAPRINDLAEPLTRGPIHEAFAQAVTPPVETGLVVNKEPPPLIEEIPPSQRPAGNDIAWIPGYWAWDDDLKDFIWISGIWRAVPPGREWVPGYWAKDGDGYRWISGYWADMRIEEVEYLPAPPETVDGGPNSNPPTGDEIWIPGVWMWQQNKYVWRAGYWSIGNPRWVWTNAHYVYTPRGYLYVSGYWDFLLPQRGMLFTPVRFQGNLPQNYVYSPRVLVNTLALTDHLFLRPTYRHYYFGDYYAANYRGRGILPYFVFHSPRYGFDSLYSFDRWRHRTDRDWDRHVHARYEDLRDRDDGRPPRDYSVWRQRRDADKDKSPFLIDSLRDYSRIQGHDWKFNDLDDSNRQTFGRYLQDLDKYRQNRLQMESQRAAARVDDNRGGDRVRLLKPPTVDGDANRNDRPTRFEKDNDAPRLDNDRPVPNRDPVHPMNDPRDRPNAGRNPLEAPKADRNPGRNPLDVPKADRNPEEGPRPGRNPLDVPKADRNPGRNPLDKPDRNPGEAPRPGRNPLDVPKSGPAPRDTPKANPAPRDVPKAVAPPRETPRETPRANPQPPRNERPPAASGKGGGNPGGGNQGKGKGSRD